MLHFNEYTVATALNVYYIFAAHVSVEVTEVQRAVHVYCDS